MTCVLCGGPAMQRHHPTARDADGRYCDPWFRVPVCIDCHGLTGDDMRTADVEFNLGSSGPEQIVVALRQVGLLCARLHVEPWATLGRNLGRALADWADRLARFLEALDAVAPDWRSMPGANDA